MFDKHQNTKLTFLTTIIFHEGKHFLAGSLCITCLKYLQKDHFSNESETHDE